MISHAINGVITPSRHELQVDYPNNHTLTTRKQLLFGYEYEFLAGWRIYDNFLLSGSVQLGRKTSPRYLFDDIINKYPSYLRYAPAQGSSRYGIYLNASLGLSFIF